MNDERLEDLLMQISAGDRDAFKSLFDETGPAMAARLAFRGIGWREAEAAIVETFGQVWEGEYTVALRPGQSLADWLGAVAESHAGKSAEVQTTPVEISPALWARVSRRAFPENWRNILRRTDVLFGIAGAVVWAVILRFIVN